jgi:nucleoside-diphosphate-sugar epimerase
MRVVVIGGTGFIGSRVGRRLRDHELTLFHRGASCTDTSHMHDDRANLARHALRADVVIDTIAMTQSDAETLAAANIAARVVVLSSGDVYRQYDLLRRVAAGPSDPLPLREDAPLRETLFPYDGDYEKILVERALPFATILRLPAVYGPGDPQKRFDAWRQPEVVMQEDYSRWRWTRGYVENVADAIVLAALSPAAAGRVYNLGEPDALTEREWAELCGARVTLVDHVDGLPPYDWSRDLVMDTRAIREELGYREEVERSAAIANGAPAFRAG